MKKRFTFKCWNCNRTYTLQREITDQQVLTVACPYCNSEGVVDLDPYRKEIKNVMKNITVMRDVSSDDSIDESTNAEEELDLPDILPTHKPE